MTAFGTAFVSHWLSSNEIASMRCFFSQPASELKNIVAWVK